MDDLTDHEDCGLDHGAKAYHELEAEAERLRADLDRSYYNRAAATAAKAEVEQLRTHADSLASRWRKAEAEVERLQDARFMLETDVERLREDLETALETVTSRNREVERLRNRTHVLQGQLDDLAARAALAKEDS